MSERESGSVGERERERESEGEEIGERKGSVWNLMSESLMAEIISSTTN